MTVALRVDVLGEYRVRRILNKLGHLEINDLLDNVGNMVANQTRRRILHDKEAPDGTEWKRLSKSYRKWKERVRPGIGMLEFDGHLRDSVTHVVSRYELEVGSNMVYAAYQHDMRPFLGLSAENEDDVEHLVRDWIQAVVGMRL